jgi:hypothetical protein
MHDTYLQDSDSEGVTYGRESRKERTCEGHQDIGDASNRHCQAIIYVKVQANNMDGKHAQQQDYLQLRKSPAKVP